MDRTALLGLALLAGAGAFFYFKSKDENDGDDTVTPTDPDPVDPGQGGGGDGSDGGDSVDPPVVVPDPDPVVANLIPITDDMTDEERAAALAHNTAELQRLMEIADGLIT